MAIVLLDTDVVSFFMKRDSRAALYAPMVYGNQVALSFMTVAELYQWAEVRKWGAQRRRQLDSMLTRYLILPADIEMCRVWGSIRATLQASGHTISPQDAWIAATALRHALPLITHNAADYMHVSGLDVRTGHP